MIKFMIIIVFIVVIMKCIENKLVIRFDTLFRKGFRKNDDKYGCWCWVR